MQAATNKKSLIFVSSLASSFHIARVVGDFRQNAGRINLVGQFLISNYRCPYGRHQPSLILSKGIRLHIYSELFIHEGMGLSLLLFTTCAFVFNFYFSQVNPIIDCLI